MWGGLLSTPDHLFVLAQLLCDDGTVLNHPRPLPPPGHTVVRGAGPRVEHTGWALKSGFTTLQLGDLGK